MRVMNKKWIGTAAAAALAGVMMIGGTFAFLTDSADKTNKFTIGNVDIEVKEEKYDEADGKNENKNIVPLQYVSKDPKVIVNSSVPTIVYLKVTVPIEEVSVANPETGIVGEKTKQEIYDIYKNTGTEENESLVPGFSSNWTQLSATADIEQGYKTYVFGYKTVLDGTDGKNTTDTLFDKVQLKNIVSSSPKELEKLNMNIQIDAYAIQASYVTGTSEKDVREAGNTINDADLETIFAKYTGQANSVAASTNPTSDTTSTGDSSDSGNTQTQDPQNPDTNPSTGE